MSQYTTGKKKYQKAAFGLQVRVKLKIRRKVKWKERKFDKIEAQYTTEKKYQMAAFGLQVRVKLKIKRKERKFDKIEPSTSQRRRSTRRGRLDSAVRVKLKI